MTDGTGRRLWARAVSLPIGGGGCAGPRQPARGLKVGDEFEARGRLAIRASRLALIDKSDGPMRRPQVRLFRATTNLARAVDLRAPSAHPSGAARCLWWGARAPFMCEART